MRRWYVRLHLSTARFHEQIGDERGATAVEYALMVAFIAAVVIVSVAALGLATDHAFSSVKFP